MTSARLKRERQGEGEEREWDRQDGGEESGRVTGGERAWERGDEAMGREGKGG